MDQLTEDQILLVTGGTVVNPGPGTADAVHFAQDYVRTYVDRPYGQVMGTEVSYFAQNGLLPSL